jgi:tetratricopeptide (TPR) repeat protein
VTIVTTTISMDWESHKKAGNDAISKSPSQAVESYTKAISLLPADDRINLAILLSNRGNIRLDFSYYVQSLSGLLAFFLSIAFSCIKICQIIRALDDCEQALIADPKYDKVQLRRGQVRRQLGQLQGAIDDFKAVISTTNNEPT